MSDSDGGTSLPIENETTSKRTSRGSSSSRRREGRRKDYTPFKQGELLTAYGIHSLKFVFPGFTLPLIISHNECEQATTYLLKEKVFILIFADEKTYYSVSNEYGVVMRILKTTKKTNGSTYMKARAMQRCKRTCSAQLHIPCCGRFQKITVKILPEIQIGSPLNSSMLFSLKSRHHCYEQSFESLRKNYKIRRYHLAQYPLSGFVYDFNETCYYVKIIRKVLTSYYRGRRIPTDPVLLSYWFAHNFQLSRKEQLELVKRNSTLDRLKLEWKYLNMDKMISCGVQTV